MEQIVTDNFNNRILIVDDESSVRKMLSEALSKEGFNVDTAEDGEEALRKFHENTYSLVATDIVMPGMNGLELLKKIKQINPFVVVIVFTAYTSDERVADSKKFGAYSYIRKPFLFDEFVENIWKGISLYKLQYELNRKDEFIRELLEFYRHYVPKEENSNRNEYDARNKDKSASDTETVLDDEKLITKIAEIIESHFNDLVARADNVCYKLAGIEKKYGSIRKTSDTIVDNLRRINRYVES